MKLRLVCALQRGGVTAEIRPDIWGVWRDRDRRRRIIGTMSGGEIELLKLWEHLISAGDSCHSILVWNNTASQRAPIDLNMGMPHALLDQLILNCRSPEHRQAYSCAARSLRNDHSRARENKPRCGGTDISGLSSICTAFSAADQAFVSALILCDATKSELVKAYDLRPDAVETKALSVLRILARAYS